MATDTRPSTAEVWDWLAQVPDPEIPVISLTDLGIIRDVAWDDDTLVVTVTPTYSGCPATAIINLDIEKALRAQGRRQAEAQAPARARLDHRLDQRRRAATSSAPTASPRRSTAPPPTAGWSAASTAWRAATSPSPARAAARPTPTKVSQFGSTPCKASYRCTDCLEPFDYFKCI